MRRRTDFPSVGETYNTLMVVMIRYWAFAAFVLLLALRQPQGMRAAVASKRVGAHILRGTFWWRKSL